MKPALTGRANALTRGKGKKIGLKRGMPPTGAPMRLPSVPVKTSGIKLATPPASGVRPSGMILMPAGTVSGFMKGVAAPASGTRPTTTGKRVILGKRS